MSFYKVRYFLANDSLTSMGSKWSNRLMLCNRCGLKSNPLFVVKYHTVQLCNIQLLSYRNAGTFIACKGCFAVSAASGARFCKICGNLVQHNNIHCASCKGDK